jgi:hypothetical protein
MGQEDIVAPQDRGIFSQHGLVEHLSHLQHMNTSNALDASRQRQEKTLTPLFQGQLRQPTADDWQEYFTDLSQRSLLFWDTLRQRGDNTLAHERAGYPLLLKFNHETLIAGSDLPRPVNYSLLRILPEPGQRIDSNGQPVIIIDPRGGHGSGIGGFKQDSVIGESLRAGHPTYFIAFSHAPKPGQTLADIVDAEAHFIEAVRALHPASSKPIVVGNCQAGWALMGLAATHPELPGLIIINGAPLSYWAGVNGRNPMRYTGGLLGGGWTTRLASDLGNDRFDGTWLVSNFEKLDPANTYWNKYYQLFSQVDSEAPRFLDFERWWGSPSLLNGEEIEMIVDNLFIGNQLSGGLGRKTNGLDLKRIEVPVVVFCSYGDNITSPQQALNWITDVYPSDLALHNAGRTIVYLQHASIGHLGIFVSGKVARREHRELLGAVEAINALSAGLYEMLIDDLPDPSSSGDAHYRVHFEPRKIADIHNDREPTRDDDREFALVERTSEINSSLYDWFVRPWIRQLVNEPSAELIRKAHPFHQQQVAWSSLNPALWWLAGTATLVRNDRHPARKDNPLLAWQDLFSNQMQDALNAYRDVRDASLELCFYGVYGGLSALLDNKPARNLQKHADLQDKALIESLHQALSLGGRLEALARILVLIGRDNDAIDKHRIEQLIQQGDVPVQHYIDPTILRETIRLQSLLVFVHPEESVSSLPLLLPQAEARHQVLKAVAQFVPELVTTTGTAFGLWRELHSLFDIPLPVFSLTQPPSEADAIQKVAPLELSQPVATQPPEVAEVTPVIAEQAETIESLVPPAERTVKTVAPKRQRAKASVSNPVKAKVKSTQPATRPTVATPAPAPTVIPAAAPTETLLPTTTPAETVIPTATPIETVIPTATPIETVIPTTTPIETVIPTAIPTATATAIPAPAPQLVPAPEPTPTTGKGPAHTPKKGAKGKKQIKPDILG